MMIVMVQYLLELLCTYSHCCINDDGNDSNGTISTGVIVHILPLLCSSLCKQVNGYEVIKFTASLRINSQCCNNGQYKSVLVTSV